jgi:hypothetical protein
VVFPLSVKSVCANGGLPSSRPQPPTSNFFTFFLSHFTLCDKGSELFCLDILYESEGIFHAPHLPPLRVFSCLCFTIWDICIMTMSHDSSVGIALGYGLDDWGSRV